MPDSEEGKMILYLVGSRLFSNLQDASIYEHIYNATIELAGGRKYNRGKDLQESGSEAVGCFRCSGWKGTEVLYGGGRICRN